MDNSENPKRCGWSIVHKAQMIGFYVGGLGTLAILLLSVFNADVALSFGMIVQWPMLRLIEMLGQDKWLYSHEGVSWIGIFLAVILNALLFFLTGTIVGWLIQKLKRDKLISCSLTK